MINIIIHGCNGKMGQVLASVAAADPEIRIAAGVDSFPQHKDNAFPTYESFYMCTEPADVIVDFSSPAATCHLLEQATERKIPLVIATTGLSPDDIQTIKQASNTIPILRSANMSIGVNLMYELSQKATSILGDEFDIEIIEKHHNQKVDAPSGTAYALADAINGVLLNSRNYVYGRNAKHNRRSKNEIGIHAVRAGTITGEHTVLFAGKDELLNITHTAYSRQIFAVGALAAAKYIFRKAPGLFSFKDMIAEYSAVTDIYTSSEQSLITVNHIPYNPQIVADLFKMMGDENINIDMISQTAPTNGEVDISFTLPDKDLIKAMDKINNFRQNMPSISPKAFDKISKLTVEGVGMELQSGVAARIFHILAKQNIMIKTITTSEIKISCIIDQVDEQRAVKAIIDEFGI